MAPKKPRIPRSTEELIASCEDHLLFLQEAFERFPKEHVRYKQIAAELRVLVCATRQNKPLLLDLMDEHEFSYDVQPPGPPFDKQPIPLVGWRNDPVQQALMAEVEEASGNEEKLAAILEKEAKLRKSMSLRDYTDNALAILMTPIDYSYCDLVLAVAQQCGSSHEDKEIEEPIAQMRSLKLGGVESHIAVLVEFARLVLDAGIKFLVCLAEKETYRTRFVGKKTD